MTRVLVLVGASVGGTVGWWLGQRFGFVLAGFLSLVGTALGVYWARRFIAEHM